MTRQCNSCLKFLPILAFDKHGAGKRQVVCTKCRAKIREKERLPDGLWVSLTHLELKEPIENVWRSAIEEAFRREDYGGDVAVATGYCLLVRDLCKINPTFWLELGMMDSEQRKAG